MSATPRSTPAAAFPPPLPFPARLSPGVRVHPVPRQSRD
jgi:hypothetical protein